MEDVTLLLARADGGDRAAADEVAALVYDELRSIAQRYTSRERRDQTLSATALVHEAWVRLVGAVGGEGWENRRHFYGAAAETMRHILVDRARERGAEKRGGGWRRLTLEHPTFHLDDTSTDGIVDLHDALDRFSAEHPQKAELVKFRFFLGLTLQDAADTLGLPITTADRHWAFAKAWLFRQLSKGAGEDESLTSR